MSKIYISPADRSCAVPRSACLRDLRCGLLLFLAACVPEVGSPPSLLTAPRVLSVRSEPPEVSPGEATQLFLTVAGPSSGAEHGALDDALSDTRWALCLASKPPVDDRFTNERCLTDESAVQPLALRGQNVRVAIPGEACARFGPQTPPSLPEQPPGRPRDPDETGGYYQPVRVQVPALGLVALAAVRIVCGLALTTPEVAAEYRAQYRRNRNPEIAGLFLQQDGAVDHVAAVPVGATLSLSLVPSLDSAEPFLRLHPATRRLETSREALRVSWFAAQGHFAFSTTAGEDSPAIRNTWQAPDEPGNLALWAVLRDSRGGVAVWSQSIAVGRGNR